MNLLEQAKAAEKSEESYKVRYGKTLTAEGPITDVYESGIEWRVEVATKMGSYSIPLVQIRRIELAGS